MPKMLGVSDGQTDQQTQWIRETVSLLFIWRRLNVLLSAWGRNIDLLIFLIGLWDGRTKWIRETSSLLFYMKTSICSTVCPRSSDPFYTVTYYIKWITTSWTDGIPALFLHWGLSLIVTPFYKENLIINLKFTSWYLEFSSYAVR